MNILRQKRSMLLKMVLFSLLLVSMLFFPGTGGASAEITGAESDSILGISVIEIGDNDNDNDDGTVEETQIEEIFSEEKSLNVDKQSFNEIFGRELTVVEQQLLEVQAETVNAVPQEVKAWNAISKAIYPEDCTTEELSYIAASMRLFDAQDIASLSENYGLSLKQIYYADLTMSEGLLDIEAEIGRAHV